MASDQKYRDYLSEFETEEDEGAVWVRNWDRFEAGMGTGPLCDANTESVEEAFKEPNIDPDTVRRVRRGWDVMVTQAGSTELTEAYKALVDMDRSLASYPVLDDTKHSQMEHDRDLEHLRSDVHYGDVADGVWATGWEGPVFSWLWKRMPMMLESARDDDGTHVAHEYIRLALYALNLVSDEARDETEIWITKNIKGAPTHFCQLDVIDVSEDPKRNMAQREVIHYGRDKLVENEKHTEICRYCREGIDPEHRVIELGNCDFETDTDCGVHLRCASMAYNLDDLKVDTQ